MIAPQAIGALAAAGAGLGAVLTVRALMPARGVDAASAIRRLTQRAAAPSPGPLPADPFSRLTRSALVARLTSSALVKTPRQDLALLGISAQAYTAYRLATALCGLALGPLLGALSAITRLHLPLEIPVGLSVVFAALLWVTSAADIVGKAAAARRDAHYHLLALLDATALEISASSAPLQAIEEAAAALDAWSTVRIRETLLRAQMAGRAPWDALEALGREIGLTALVESAGMLRAAEAEGTGAHARLTTRADALRAQLAADEQAAALSASERMVMPMTVLVLLFLILVGFPLITRIR